MPTIPIISCILAIFIAIPAVSIIIPIINKITYIFLYLLISCCKFSFSFCFISSSFCISKIVYEFFIASSISSSTFGPLNFSGIPFFKYCSVFSSFSCNSLYLDLIVLYVSNFASFFSCSSLFDSSFCFASLICSCSFIWLFSSANFCCFAVKISASVLLFSKFLSSLFNISFFSSISPLLPLSFI